MEARAHGRRGDAEGCLAAVGRAEDEFVAADPGGETAAWHASVPAVAHLRRQISNALPAA